MKIILILSILSFMTSCLSAERRDYRSQKMSAEQQSERQDAPAVPRPSEVQPSARICKSTIESRFSLFNDCYDYNPEDQISVESLKQMLPVVSSEVNFLKDGSEFFAARMNLLENAKRTVKIQSLTFTNDESAALIANKLIELRKRGVRVQIIVDSVHNLTVPEQELYFKLQTNGVQVEGFQYLYLGLFEKAINLDSFGMSLGQLNMRDHEKLFIVDGEDSANGRAIIGGANIANRYFQVQLETPEFMWRDRDALVKGEVVRTMSRGFDENFQKKQQARENGLFQSAAFWWKIIDGFTKDGEPFDLSKRDSLILSRLNQAQERYNPAQIDWTEATVRFLKSRPREREDLIQPAYLTMIKDSKSRIQLLNSYFLPDDSFVNALRDAAGRGVKIEIMTNHAKNTDFKQLTLLTRSYYSDLLSMNKDGEDPKVIIREWAGDETLNNGEGQNHSKVAIFDDEVVFVGSYNLDPRSHKLNSESLIAIKSKTAAIPYIQEFDLFSGENFSVNITLEDAKEYEANRSLRENLELKILEVIKPLL